MRPLSLTVRAAEPGERYDRLNEVSFRQEVARVIESLPALFDGRYLRLDGGELSGALTVPALTVRDGTLWITKAGKASAITANVADGDYGYLDLGGGTTLRGAEQVSTFAGKVGIGTIAPRARLTAVGDGGPSIHVSDNGAAGVYSYARYISLDVNSPGVYPTLIIPNSTAARVVVVMLDGSSGSRVGAWELWVSSSPTHCVNSREIKAEPNDIIGADVYWKATSGTVEDVDKRTLILDTTKDGFTNQFLVHVEHYCHDTPIQWLL